MKIKSKILGLLFLATFFAVSISCTKDDITEEGVFIESSELELDSSSDSDRSSMRSANSGGS